ncbi:MAG: hypothetical protein MJE68_11835, partial [Proteobacteria bacterium]|nr:hypothetical protein [Pseudomonadota bacterium]
SSRNSRHATPIMRPVLAFRESFLREMLFSYPGLGESFLPRNFPAIRYMDQGEQKRGGGPNLS